jgi:outer membrane protein assembly factor BamA
LLGRGLINLDTTETINFRNSIRAVSLEHDRTDDLYNPSEGYSWKGIFEEAGFLEKIGVSPLPQADESKDIRSTEYFKLEGITKYFHDLSKDETTILGLKFRLGGIFRYGKSKEDDLPVPPNRRYYAGGASSIRGWTSRELAADTNALNIGSNVLLEMSSEIRIHLFPDARNWTDAIWVVVFMDAGNLWNEMSEMKLAETAMAFGFGLRYNFFFGPIRFDFGVKGYNPASEHHRWFFEKRLMSEVIAKGVFLFGVGHAF